MVRCASIQDVCEPCLSHPFRNILNYRAYADPFLPIRPLVILVCICMSIVEPIGCILKPHLSNERIVLKAFYGGYTAAELPAASVISAQKEHSIVLIQLHSKPGPMKSSVPGIPYMVPWTEAMYYDAAEQDADSCCSQIT